MKATSIIFSRDEVRESRIRSVPFSGRRPHSTDFITCRISPVSQGAGEPFTKQGLDADSTGWTSRKSRGLRRNNPHPFGDDRSRQIQESAAQSGSFEPCLGLSFPVRSSKTIGNILPSVAGDKSRSSSGGCELRSGTERTGHFSPQLYLLGLLYQNQGVCVHETAQNTAVRRIPSKPGVWLGAWVQQLERDLVPVPPAKIVWLIPEPRGLTSVGCHKRSDDRRGFTQWPRHGSLGGALPWLAQTSEASPRDEGTP